MSVVTNEHFMILGNQIEGLNSWLIKTHGSLLESRDQGITDIDQQSTKEIGLVVNKIIYYVEPFVEILASGYIVSGSHDKCMQVALRIKACYHDLQTLLKEVGNLPIVLELLPKVSHTDWADMLAYMFQQDQEFFRVLLDQVLHHQDPNLETYLFRYYNTEYGSIVLLADYLRSQLKHTSPPHQSHYTTNQVYSRKNKIWVSGSSLLFEELGLVGNCTPYKLELPTYTQNST